MTRLRRFFPRPSRSRQGLCRLILTSLITRGGKLRVLAVVAALHLQWLVAGTAAQEAKPPALLPSLLLQSRLPLCVDGGVFGGAGWRLILDRISDADFIAIGEDHLTQEIPLFAGALCDVLGPQGLSALAVEAGPEAARFVNANLRIPDHLARMAGLVDRYPDAVAFLDVVQENDLASRCSKASSRADFEIWGLDQEFLGSAGWLLDQILDQPLQSNTRAVMLRLRGQERSYASAASGSGDPARLFLFQVSDDDLAAAEECIQKEGSDVVRRLFAALRTTHEIYKGSMSDAGESNARRARLLKRNLATHLAASSMSTRPRKILAKFGEWHLYRGYNPLDVRDLGNFVAEYADVNGGRSLHIAVLGAKGTHAVYGGYARPAREEPFVMTDDPDYAWLKDAVALAEPQGWTLFDLQQLRGRKLSRLPLEWQRLALGYDILVLIPTVRPAAMVQVAH